MRDQKFVRGTVGRPAPITGARDRTHCVDDRAATGLAAFRALLGVAALMMPERAGRAWIGDGASGRDRAVLLRALGGRDVALGVGALVASGRGDDPAGWLAMGALSDLVDAVATAAGFGALPPFRRWMVLTASAGAAVVGFRLAKNLSAHPAGGARRP